MESVRGWTQEHARSLSLNIASFLEQVTSNQGGVPLELPELTEEEVREACPEQAEFPGEAATQDG